MTKKEKEAEKKWVEANSARKRVIELYGTDDEVALEGITRIETLKAEIAHMMDEGFNVNYAPRWDDMQALIYAIVATEWEMNKGISHPIWNSYGRCHFGVEKDEEERWKRKYEAGDLLKFYEIVFLTSAEGRDKEIPDLLRAAFPNEPDILKSHWKKIVRESPSVSNYSNKILVTLKKALRLYKY